MNYGDFVLLSLVGCLSLIGLDNLLLHKRIQSSLIRRLSIRIWRITAYQLFSYFFLVGIWIFLSLHFPSNIMGFTVTGHALSWIAVLMVFSRYGYFDMQKGLYYAGYLYSAHEGLYVLVAGFKWGLIALTHFWLLEVFVIAFFIVFAPLSIPRQKLLRFWTVLLLCYTLWYFAGFHVTVNNIYSPAQTIYYTDPNVNFIEIINWLLPAVSFI
jgi:hypothetical protein